MQHTDQIREILTAYRTTYERRSMARRAPTRAERDVLDLCQIADAMTGIIEQEYDALCSELDGEYGQHSIVLIDAMRERLTALLKTYKGERQ